MREPAHTIAKTWLICVVVSLSTFCGAASASAQSVPKPLKTRFIIGDPMWRELPVRTDLQSQYEKSWQTVIGTILENNFDIATMDKDSGYIRTTWNEGVLVLGGNWYYKVQVSIKFVMEADGTPDSMKPSVAKLRLQVAGELTQVTSRGVRAYYRGFDQVILQNILQDLQSKLGTI